MSLPLAVISEAIVLTVVFENDPALSLQPLAHLEGSHRWAIDGWAALSVLLADHGRKAPIPGVARRRRGAYFLTK